MPPSKRLHPSAAASMRMASASGPYPWPWQPRPDASVTPCSYKAVGKHDFTATHPDELGFCEGEQLYIIARADSVKYPRGWLVAQNNSQQKGVVPESYVQWASALPGAQPTPAAVLAAVSTLNAELSKWPDPHVPLLRDQSEVFARQLRDLANWLAPPTPEEAAPPPAD